MKIEKYIPGIVMTGNSISPAFKEKVEKELFQAELGVRDVLGLPVGKKNGRMNEIKKPVRYQRQQPDEAHKIKEEIVAYSPLERNAFGETDGMINYKQSVGYEYLSNACPECNGAVRISPAYKRTVCTNCKIVLYPLESAGASMLNLYSPA